MARLFCHPIPVLMLCLSLVGTPVSYRGGASVSHPHTFVEFLLDARTGDFGHHHGSRDAHRAAHSGDAETGHDPNVAEGAMERFGVSLAPFVVSDVAMSAIALPARSGQEGPRISIARRHAETAATGIDHAPVPPPPRSPMTGVRITDLLPAPFRSGSSVLCT